LLSKLTENNIDSYYKCCTNKPVIKNALYLFLFNFAKQGSTDG
jgi:hypothetical protein